MVEGAMFTVFWMNVDGAILGDPCFICTVDPHLSKPRLSELSFKRKNYIHY